MRRREWTPYLVIRYAMTGVGVMLLLLLLWKMAGYIKWNMMGEKAGTAWNELGEVCLEQIWKERYPLSGTDIENGEQAPWYVLMVRSIYPSFQYKGGGRKTEAGSQSDPAYEKYLYEQKISQEYQYLFLYGGEDTSLEPSQQPDTMVVTPPAGEMQEDPVQNVPGKIYLKEQLADYDYMIKNFYSIHSSTTAGRDLMNADTFLDRNFKLTTGADQPQILIYHTHSQETFVDFGPDKPDANVIGMGNYLTSLLQQKGYNVIHDTSVYDLRDGKLDRNKAYTYALDGITRILQENPSVEVVLDLHRDGVREGVHLVSDVNGKPTANIMFFNGLSQTPTGEIEYLKNPYREDNLAFSFQMQLKAAAYYPGYTRKIYLKGLRYNMHLRPASALVEVGAQTNTYQEALNAMEPLAEVLDMVLQGK
ncbi:stage II sporulation protein P [Clostridium sp. MCC353]|uniref:stage II sporulation protein P n=1 Tax=Clostridium sp. MCC353 TaxID=2592646 RepID=UPI0031FED7F7